MTTLLSVDEVAAQLKCKPRKVRDLITSGRLRAIDLSLGGERASYRIDPQDVVEFMSQSVVPQPVVQERPKRRQQLRKLKFIKV